MECLGGATNRETNNERKTRRLQARLSACGAYLEFIHKCMDKIYGANEGHRMSKRLVWVLSKVLFSKKVNELLEKLFCCDR